MELEIHNDNGQRTCPQCTSPNITFGYRSDWICRKCGAWFNSDGTIINEGCL